VVDEMPEMQRESGLVSKHVMVASELSRIVERDRLLQVSQLEQDIACREAENEHRKALLVLLADGHVTPWDKLRLALLFALRYEASATNALPSINDKLLAGGVSAEQVRFIAVVLRQAGASRRSADVFMNRTFFAKAANTVRRGIGGIDNIYTQHEPLLAGTLDALLRARLPHETFPLMTGTAGAGTGASSNRNASLLASTPGNDAAYAEVPQKVIVVIVGGATYEELKCVSAINGHPSIASSARSDGNATAAASAAARAVGASIMLTAPYVHDSHSFVQELVAKDRLHDR